MKTQLGIIPVVLLALSSCGGGSGGGGSSHTDSNALGMRNVPGGSIAVDKLTTIQPGSPATFRLTIGPGSIAPTQVRAWIGVNYDPSSFGIAAALESGATNVYDVTLDTPAVMPAESHVWVRLVLADGSVIESGADDFPID